jgi:hypothetical protein
MMDSGRLAPHIMGWMQSLALRRPVFHSEFDFQLALSTVMERAGVERIRLETMVRLDGNPRFEIDIVAYLNGVPIALELKYPKASFTGTVPADGYDEYYDLPTSGAFDIDARGVWKDASRIEALIGSEHVKAGAAVVLSNYPFWSDRSHRQGTQAHGFRLWEAREAARGTTLEFPDSAKWTTSDHGSVHLNSSYRCQWHPFSTPAGVGKNDFRYLILEPESSSA